MRYAVVFAAVVAGGFAWAQAPAPPAAPVTAAPAAPAADAVTDLEDQTDVAVTIYNSNLALVRDRRTVRLPSGELRLLFADVAQQIKPETVSLEAVDKPGTIRILEQNYEFDLISPQKLMEKYVGKGVRLVNFSTEIGFQSVDAQLMSVNEGPVYRIQDEIYLGHPGTVVLPEIPENLIAKPSLVWLLDNAGGARVIEATYLTQGVRWSADYVATYAEAEGKMALKGWVTLVNESGAQYTNALLQLVAGEVNIVPPPQPLVMYEAMDAARSMPAAPPPMQQEAFGEYHLYTLDRPTTIKQNQSKQVSLLTAENVGVQKLYEYRGDMSFYSQPIPPIGEKDRKVEVFLKFWNKEENGLGLPLPAGVVRVYEEDSRGLLQFSGEDRIEHTPKDEEVRVKLGNAFDVVGERTQTDYQRIADNVHEAAFEIKLRNHKETPITVDIVEPMTSDWTILQSSHEYKKKDAQTAVFSVPVPVDGETVVTYRVRVRY